MKFTWNGAGKIGLAVVVACAAASCTQTDPYAAGCALAEWSRIDQIQRYPLFDEQMPDWKDLSRDASPIVRAAAAIGIGRTEDASLVPLLIPLLDEEKPLIRCCALWALLQMESPEIKEPLLKAIGSWDELKMEVVGYDFRSSWSRVGLPDDLPGMPLSRRQAWLEGFDQAGWQIDFKEPAFPTAHVVMCIKDSEMDSGDSLYVRTRIHNKTFTKPAGLSLPMSHGERKASSFLEGMGKWILISPSLITKNEIYEKRLFFPGDIEAAEEDLDATIAVGDMKTLDFTAITRNKPPDPGIYLLRAFGASHPVFVRIRRNEAMEAQLPGLLADLAASGENVRLLSEQRVQAAVPTLIALFREKGNEDGPLGFELADALARIGDVSAVPVLLERPSLQNNDLLGSTSGALHEFGEAAYPYYEEIILNWKQHTAPGETHNLETALTLLGPNGPEAVDQARLQLIKKFTQEAIEREHANSTERHAVNGPLRAAVVASAPKHPNEAIEAIWAVKDNDTLCSSMLQSLTWSGLRPQEARPIVEELWRRFQNEPQINPFTEKWLLRIIQTHASDILLESTKAVGSSAEALSLLGGIEYAEHPKQEIIVAKAETFLRGKSDLLVQLGLAKAYYHMGEYEKCIAMADRTLKEFEDGLVAKDPGQQRSRAYYYRGQSKAKNGDPDGGVADLKMACDLLPPAYGYDGVDESTIKAQLDIVASMPRVPGVRIRELIFTGMQLSNAARYIEFCEGRCFWIDSQKKLHCYDPVTQAHDILANLHFDVRDFMPVDESRVFAALADGTACLYEKGKVEPIWKRPLSLGFNSFLSASPQAITAADEQGNLFGIEPSSGNTLWTRTVRGTAWPSRWLRSKRGLIQQYGGGLLIPDREECPASRFDWVDATTGQTIWSHQYAFGVEQIAIGKEIVAAVGRKGDIEAVSRADGSSIWKQHLQDDGEAHLDSWSFIVNEYGADAQIYAAKRDTVWSLQLSNGEVQWRWKWNQLSGKYTQGEDDVLRPHLFPTSRALFCVMQWDANDAVWGPQELTDVVCLSHGGVPQFQATCGVLPLTSQGLQGGFIQGQKLCLLRGMLWEVWDF